MSRNTQTEKQVDFESLLHNIEALHGLREMERVLINEIESCAKNLQKNLKVGRKKNETTGKLVKKRHSKKKKS